MAFWIGLLVAPAAVAQIFRSLGGRGSAESAATQTGRTIRQVRPNKSSEFRIDRRRGRTWAAPCQTGLCTLSNQKGYHAFS
jgi:hypothetical protein